MTSNENYERVVRFSRKMFTSLVVNGNTAASKTARYTFESYGACQIKNKKEVRN